MVLLQSGAKVTITRPQKITFGEMRSSGVTGVIVYCQNFRCSHWTKITTDRWPDHVRLSDIEPMFSCQAYGRRGGDVRPEAEGSFRASSRDGANAHLSSGQGSRSEA